MKKSNIILICLFPIALLINVLGSHYKSIVENFYSLKINKLTIKIISDVTRPINFSIYEIFLYGTILFTILYIGIYIYKIIKAKNTKKKVLISFIANTLSILSLIYFLFIFSWGLNYNRVPFKNHINYRPDFTKEELIKVYSYLTTKANEARTRVKENDKGIMILNSSLQHTIDRSYLGYDKTKNEFPTLKSDFTNVKVIKTSDILIYSSITGIYFPFTAEANINSSCPTMTMPITILHEMAHGNGYTSEDEANFISFLTGINHPDADFQYSGYFFALVHVGNQLASVDQNVYNSLKNNLSDGVLRDMKYRNDFWLAHKGLMNKVSSKINDLYLKSNGIKEGEGNYSEVSNLILSYYLNPQKTKQQPQLTAQKQI